MLKDLRHAIRMLFHAKGWTAVVVVSLALGIGANTALFSAVDSMLLTTIPVKDPDTLVRLRWVGRNDMLTSSSDYGSINRAAYGGQNVRTTFSYPMYQQFVADNRTMTDVAACAPFGRVNAVVDGQAELASAFVSTGNFYQMLGVASRIGRTIGPADDKPTAPPVAVISSKYWHTRFGTDPGVVGKTIKINNVLVTVVGVMSPSFTGIQQPVAELQDILLPLALMPQLEIPGPGPSISRLAQPTYWWLQIMGRLKPGSTAAQVQGNLEAVFQNTARAGLDTYLKSLTDKERSASGNQNRTEVPHLRVEPGSRGIYDVNTNELRSITILSVVVALVLLIVCANVANLLLSRATTRQKELSVRLSLGATRGRLIRQLLTESLLLASIGGALGVLVGYWGRQLLPGSAGSVSALDWRVLAFVVVVTGATGIVFGIAPAFRGTGMNVNSALKETGRGVVGARSLLGKALLIVQVAISLVLLIGAGLFLRTLENLRHVDVGFNPQNLLLFRVNPSLNRYDEKRMASLYHDMIERLGTLPGVRGAAMSQPALLSGSVNSTSIYIQGRAYSIDRSQRDSNSINRLVISPNFFDVMGIPVVLGRGLTERDTASAPKVVVINEAAVKKYFPNQNPIGQHFGSSLETTGQLEIVGVLHDAKYDSVRDAAPPTMYVPYAQTRLGNAVFELRTAALPAAAMGAVRDAVRQIDPNLPVTDVSTQIEQVEQRFGQEKLFAQAYTLFGALALLLASIGLFGLMSYSVARRTNEIGIRMALGAQRQDVLRLVMRESMVLVVAGIAAGVAIALAASRSVEALLFGLPPTDAVSMTLAVAVMMVVSALAGYLPARRASRVDPMVALHYE
ncbi:MAG TPA: ABC transporter permease [Vicinamibacterales bacterium]|jgi:predicted permease|nr:ABC transporter permease [Vicinamibacterales bacterium]